MKRNIINKLKRLLFMIFKLKVTLYDKINKPKYQKNIALVSCDKWKNKVIDDVKLKHYLNKHSVGADIISWQDNDIDYKKYDSVVIRSIWGYVNYKDAFFDWLKLLEKNNVKIFNSVEVIKKNYDKYIQFNILKKNHIQTVKTEFLNVDENIIEKLEKLNIKKLFVIKPSISESSNDTYIIGNQNTEYKNVISKEQVIDKFKNINKDSRLMIQPFIEEVFNGEYSICCINGKITHAVLKFNDVFSGGNWVKYIPSDSLDPKIIEITEKVLQIDEYKDNLYIRLDIIKHKTDYLVMEVELLDPNLLISFISDKKIRNEVYDFFALCIIEQLS